jgi:hypothetical protein
MSIKLVVRVPTAPTARITTWRTRSLSEVCFSSPSCKSKKRAEMSAPDPRRPRRFRSPRRCGEWFRCFVEGWPSVVDIFCAIKQSIQKVALHRESDLRGQLFLSMLGNSTRTSVAGCRPLGGGEAVPPSHRKYPTLRCSSPEPRPHAPAEGPIKCSV